MYNNLIKSYIDNITINDINNFLNKKNLSVKEEDKYIVLNIIKNNYNTLLNNPEEVLNNLKNKISNNTYEIIINLYNEYKSKIIN